MSQKRPTKDKSVADAPQPVLAQKLFAAINEHEAVLARVSRLLHDDVSQILSAVGLQLDAMRMDFREQAPGFDSRAAEIQELLEQAIEQLRDISNELNPSIVESGWTAVRARPSGREEYARTSLAPCACISMRPCACPPFLRRSFIRSTECALRNSGKDARAARSSTFM